MKPLTISLTKIGKEKGTSVGMKAFRLAELLKNGFLVPRAFVVTVEAFEIFLEKNNLVFLVERLSVERDRSILEKICRQLQKKIKKGKLPSNLEKEILTKAKKVGISSFAVRSSATSEDLSFASFAGQFESCLNISSESLIDSVKDCWASLYEERVLSYTLFHQIPMHQIKMAVLIQEMVMAEKGGVMFTKDILRDNERVVIIEVVNGLGERVVSGTEEPDRYIVEKIDLKTIGQKLKAAKPILSPEEIFELAKMGLLIENFYQSPQDIEWAIKGGKTYLLQSRPITT